MACSAASWSAASLICCAAVSTWSAADFCCWVARIDSSSIVAVEAISSPTSYACLMPCSVAMIVAFVSSWTPAMITPIDSVDRMDRSASLRTSAATTAKPRPASPARAASIAAFSASRLVCAEISLISSRISPIFWPRSPSDSARSAIAWTFSCMSCMVSPARSVASDTERTVSAIDPAVAASSRIVVDVCATAADCSLVTAAAFRAATRSSAATSAEDPRRGPQPRQQLVTVAQPRERRGQRLLTLLGAAQQSGHEPGEAEARQHREYGGGDADRLRLPGGVVGLGSGIGRARALQAHQRRQRIGDRRRVLVQLPDHLELADRAGGHELAIGLEVRVVTCLGSQRIGERGRVGRGKSAHLGLRPGGTAC